MARAGQFHHRIEPLQGLTVFGPTLPHAGVATKQSTSISWTRIRPRAVVASEWVKDREAEILLKSSSSYQGAEHGLARSARLLRCVGQLCGATATTSAASCPQSSNPQAGLVASAKIARITGSNLSPCFCNSATRCATSAGKTDRSYSSRGSALA